MAVTDVASGGLGISRCELWLLLCSAKSGAVPTPIPDVNRDAMQLDNSFTLIRFG